MQIKPLLKKIASDNSGRPDLYIRNSLKECLQIPVLHYIYSSPGYRELFFYGGTCLAQCYGLPRLSEDLDFVDAEKTADIENMASELKEFFRSETDLEAEVKTQKFRIYLKFPVLADLGLSRNRAESDYLFVKIEIFTGFDFCRDFTPEFKPVFKFGYSVLVKTFDRPTLMSTKIRAVLNRRWEKTDKKGKVLASVKGRDFFDLMWFLRRGVEPNLKCIEEVNSKEELKKKLLKAVENLDNKSVSYDLENFVADKEFAIGVGGNMKEILQSELKNW
jgi:hypothetical protein